MMDSWKRDALVNQENNLKKQLGLTEVMSLLEKPAGGFMTDVERMSVDEEKGRIAQVDKILKILRSKDGELTEYVKGGRTLRKRPSTSQEVEDGELTESVKGGQTLRKRPSTSKEVEGPDQAPDESRGAQPEVIPKGVAASQFSVLRFLETYEDKFLEVVNPKLSLPRLKHKGVISADVSTAIENANEENAKYILLEHLQKNATVDTLGAYCDVAIAANGFARMQELGRKMKDALPPGAQAQPQAQDPEGRPTSGTVQSSGHCNPSGPSEKQERVSPPSLRAHGTTTIMLRPMPTELKVISGVLLHNKVYISGTDTKGRQVQVYSPEDDTWSTLPEAPNYNAPIAIVDNRITLIGGRDVKTNKPSNVISTWFEEEERWKQSLHSLPTMLLASEAYHHGDILLVTGGVEEGNSTAVDKVHVCNLSSNKWATPQQLRLPKALRSHHLVRLGEYIYLLGGATRFQDPADTTHKHHNLNAWKARWADIEEAVQHQDLTVQPSHQKKSIWKSIADLPVPLPTVVLCGSSIISVGGKENNSPVREIYEFAGDKDNNQWVKVGDMSVGRYHHGVVPLGTRGAALLVAGGFKWELYDENTVKTTSVELVLL